MDPHAPLLRSTARCLAALVMFASPLLGAIQETSPSAGNAPASVASELVEDALKHDIQLTRPPTRAEAAGQRATRSKPTPFWLIVFTLAAMILVMLQRLEAAEDPLLGNRRRRRRDTARGEAEGRRSPVTERQVTASRERQGKAPQVVPLPPHVVAHLQRGKPSSTPAGSPPATEGDEHLPPKQPVDAPPDLPVDDHSRGGSRRGRWEFVLPAYKPWSSEDPR